jgi:hypothetical protein
MTCVMRNLHTLAEERNYAQAWAEMLRRPAA